MATTSTTLSAINPAAERALFGQPDYTVLMTATAGALSATSTPGAGQIARMKYLTVSYSAAPAVSVLQVKAGSTVLWQAELSATGPWVYHFDFSMAPLRGAKGGVLSADVGSAGGAVVQTISWIGDFITAP